ncbi:SIR2 family protein [Providencia rettgeri]|uniref:SIR2 family protein n=1 Tax=Providencia rettgeri TaxID=587 RepID=UPI001BA7C4BE|nr:SIR2 family protein [Providencia rettgeri]MBS0858353.1 SIR2 family protein [Providencia rettgeri]MBS0872092.1 SIR2 family protein [Providencia rettgeri]MBS0919238.1 SIR2 family protein [Providencia rettgeri]
MSCVEINSELLRKVRSNRAVLFLGSGFSCDSTDFNQQYLPTANILAQKIAKIINAESYDDLKYISDRVIDEGYSEALIKLLRKTFSVKQVQPHHETIASLPWHRVYTTNYDLCFEKAAQQIGKDYTTIDVSIDSISELKKQNLCIHINGSLNNLDHETLNNSFKLSESSYLSTDSIENSQWFYPMQRDFEEASAIIFIGYSLYDIEVKKILLDSLSIKNKVYFVTYSIPDERSAYIFEKYGTILPIQTSGFSEIFKNFKSDDDNIPLRILNNYHYNPTSVTIKDSDTDRFLLTGDIEEPIIDSFISKFNKLSAPILIYRSEINKAFELIKNRSNVLITSELGNGKSIFLKILCSILSQNSYDVYQIESINNNIYSDIEKISQGEKTSILVFDSYDKYIDILKFTDRLHSANIILVLSARSSSHEYYFSKIKFENISLNEIELDELDHDEVLELINIIDNTGFWEDKASLNIDAKISLIDRKYKNQLSLTLLGLLNSPVILSKIKESSSVLINNKNFKKTIFTICLLSFLDLPLTKSFISEIAQNRAIYDQELTKQQAFLSLFDIDKSRAQTKSSLFSLSFISNILDSNYIIDELLSIVENLGDTKNDLHEKKELQKNILRFSIVERLLPSSGRKASLTRYYEYVKRALPNLKEDPHYWLQYGMAMLTYNDYTKAERFFKNSYSLASNRVLYHTQHTDVQYSRLNLMKANDKSLDLSITDRFKLFEEAHIKLCAVDNDIHRYRQLHLYKDIFDMTYNSLSNKNKTYFEFAFKRIISDIDKLDADDYRLANSKTVKSIRRMASDCLNIIVSARS